MPRRQIKRKYDLLAEDLLKNGILNGKDWNTAMNLKRVFKDDIKVVPIVKPKYDIKLQRRPKIRAKTLFGDIVLYDFDL